MKRTVFIAAVITSCVVAAVSAANAQGDAPGTGATTPPPVAATSPFPAGSSTNEPTIVTSEHLQADYLHNVGTFEGNVLAVDPRMTVRADKMTVFFGGTNIVTSTGTNTTRSIQKIFAEGAVVINTPDNKTAHGDQAEYTADEGKVVLTGKPRVETPDGIVTGQKITFWRGSQKMDVVAGGSDTNRTRLLIYPEEQRKKE